jgi:NAD(P)-dependent dehydrogenase (short-subunit alcohol dehydrogenase family)
MNKPWHSLTNQLFWVTGGAGHLGSPITVALDQAGARVLCIDLPGQAERLVREEKLTRTTPLALDINDSPALPALVDRLVAEHGLPDGVAHLATRSSRGLHLADLPISDFQQTMDGAVTPSFVLGRSLAERMKSRGTGSIVFFSSMYGLVAPDPRIYLPPMIPNPIDYGAAKAALLQVTRYLAVHYGPSGLRFNCVTPGPFPKPSGMGGDAGFVQRLSAKTALNRIGQNTEIVGPTLFLLSDSASYVTGHSLVVDGGWTAH